MNEDNTYDLVIIGAGVSGAAQFYAAAKYTDYQRVLLVEKESAAGGINSAAWNNSQTLHEGDIETNYDLEKATAVKHKAGFTRHYVTQKNDPQLALRGPKMVFGVGEREVSFLEERHEAFTTLFPDLEKIGAEELRQREPKMMEGRDSKESVIGLYNQDGLTINYGRLASELITDAEAAVVGSGREFSVRFDTKVDKLTKEGDGYSLQLGEQLVHTGYVSVCAGAHSMYFAKQLEVAAVQDMSLLCIAGNFYHTPKYVETKVYTVQDPKLPFSAVHADPDILHADKNRFGPTTRVVWMLERHRYGTVGEYFSTLSPVIKTLMAYVRIMLDPAFVAYAFKHNVLLFIPWLGNYLYLKETRKIVPTIKYSDVKRAYGQGGVRPQIVRTNEAKPLNLGEAKLEGDMISFNVTPSPGASTCVFNGLYDMRRITERTEHTFDESRLAVDFGTRLDT